MRADTREFTTCSFFGQRYQLLPVCCKFYLMSMHSIFNFAGAETPIMVTRFGPCICDKYYTHILKKCKHLDIYFRNNFSDTYIRI